MFAERESDKESLLDLLLDSIEEIGFYIKPSARMNIDY